VVSVSRNERREREREVSSRHEGKGTKRNETKRNEKERRGEKGERDGNLPVAPTKIRCSTHALSGATPVPGPTRMSGVEGEEGRVRVPGVTWMGIEAPGRKKRERKRKKRKGKR